MNDAATGRPRQTGRPLDGDEVVICGEELAPRARLPYDDASCDTLVCRQGLQLSADRGMAVREIRRVLVPGGRALIDVWGRLERNPGFAALAGSLERVAGLPVAAAVHWLCSLPDPADLKALLAAGGFIDPRVRAITTAARYPSVTGFLARHVPRFPIGVATSQMTPDQWDRVEADLRSDLSAWIDDEGMTLPAELVVATATR